MIEVITKNEKETQEFAKSLALKLIRRKKKIPIIALKGGLGSGKTTFVKGFSRAFGIREKILSPTFVLIHKHKISAKPYKTLYHIDAYRLKSGKDLLKLGIKEIFSDPKNIILIEWAEKLKKIIPQNAIWINFKNFNKNKRKIILKNIKDEKINSY